jgi:hypothetical protein
MLFEILEGEEFRDIEGYEGLYKVSNMGRVWGCKRENFLKPSIFKRDAGKSYERHYYNVILCKNGIKKDFLIHRLVAKTFCFKPSLLHTQVDHINCKGFPEDGLDNRAENLAWKTPQQNIRNKVTLTKGYSLTSDKNRKYAIALTNPKTYEIQYFGRYNTEEEAIIKVAEIQAQWKLQYPECY